MSKANHALSMPDPSAHLRRIAFNSYDIQTVAGLIEALGGEAAVAASWTLARPTCTPG